MDPIVNAREPRGEEGRRFLEHMNADHEEMARWGTSFLTFLFSFLHISFFLAKKVNLSFETIKEMLCLA